MVILHSTWLGKLYQSKQNPVHEMANFHLSVPPKLMFSIHDITTYLNHKVKWSALVTDGRYAQGNGKSMIETIRILYWRQPSKKDSCLNTRKNMAGTVSRKLQEFWTSLLAKFVEIYCSCTIDDVLTLLASFLEIPITRQWKSYSSGLMLSPSPWMKMKNGLCNDRWKGAIMDASLGYLWHPKWEIFEGKCIQTLGKFMATFMHNIEDDLQVSVSEQYIKPSLPSLPTI